VPDQSLGSRADHVVPHAPPAYPSPLWSTSAPPSESMFSTFVPPCAAWEPR
jgi:hypothetical protein